VLLLTQPVRAANAGANTDEGLQNVGEGVAIALPLIAGGISAYKNDWAGAAQLVLATGATVGTSYLLSHFVKEGRPYCQGQPGCDDHSFPSNTAALAFAPAQYLWQRYGWEYGIPAYAAAGFVGASRIISSQHHWWDVATSGAISLGYNEIITTRYHQPYNLTTSISATPGGAFVALNYRW
jgi:membrane-associated phospholipid phosphatase